MAEEALVNVICHPLKAKRRAPHVSVRASREQRGRLPSKVRVRKLFIEGQRVFQLFSYLILIKITKENINKDHYGVNISVNHYLLIASISVFFVKRTKVNI